MEKVFIQKARIVFPTASFHDQVVNLRLQNGILVEVGNDLFPQTDETIISGNELHLFPGLVDVGAESGEPGLEHRETMVSLLNAGKSGGYTHLVIMPNTVPVADNKSVIRYLQAADSNPRLWPMGALSQNCEGKDLAEFFEMYEEGVQVFTDGDKSIQAADLLLRAMEYASAFGGIVMHHPEDQALAGSGMAHESLLAVKLGLKTKPALAEYLQVIRDLELAAFTNCPIILHKLSLPESVQLVDRAKKMQGVSVATTISANNLFFNEDCLESFDSRFKLRPVLRTKAQQSELWDCVKNGMVDMIVSDHRPRDVEEKVKEFDLALSGATGLETTIPALFDLFYQELTASRWIDLLSFNPRKWMGIPLPVLALGAPVDFTLIDFNQPWKFSQSNTQSLAANSPWLDHTFKHRIVRTFYQKPSIS